MELLEDRRVLAIFVVDTTIDTVDVNLGDGVAADIDGMTSLRAAVMEANALTGDDTINLPDGTYVLTLASVVPLDFTDLDVTDTTGNLTIAGAAAATTIIDGNQSDRVIHVLSVASLALSDVTLTRGLISFEDGAGLFNEGGTVSVTDSIITGNAATFGIDNDGGGIENDPFGSLTLVNTVVSNNMADDEGGGIGNEGQLTISGGSITDNTAGMDGGGIGNEGTMTITDTEISGNTPVRMLTASEILIWASSRAPKFSATTPSATPEESATAAH